VKLKPRDSAATAGGQAGRDAGIDLDKPIFTLSVASEILETHPRTLMMYEHLDMIRPKRTVTNRRRYSRRDVLKLQDFNVSNLQSDSPFRDQVNMFAGKHFCRNHRAPSSGPVEDKVN